MPPVKGSLAPYPEPGPSHHFPAFRVKSSTKVVDPVLLAYISKRMICQERPNGAPALFYCPILREQVDGIGR